MVLEGNELNFCSFLKKKKFYQHFHFRILPVDAHKICTDRLYVSITRWKDGKNFLISKFESREDLIQALICSSFVPGYSGMIPPKFRGTVS